MTSPWTWTPWEPDNRFRTIPNGDLIRPLLLAYGKALQEMPMLERSDLTLSIDVTEWLFEPESSPDHNEVLLSYRALGFKGHFGSFNLRDDISCRRIYSKLGGLLMSREVAEVFNNIGKNKHGGRCFI